MLIRTARLHDHEHIRLCRIRLTGLERRGDRHVAQTLPKFSRSNTRRSRRVQAYALFRKVLREKICCAVNLVNWYHAKLFVNPIFRERGLLASELFRKVLRGGSVRAEGREPVWENGGSYQETDCGAGLDTL